MKRFIVFWLCLIPLICSAGTEADSLLGLWRQGRITDSVFLESFDDMIYIMTDQAPDSARILAQQELAIARERNQPVFVAWAYNRLGSACYYQGHSSEAVRYYRISMLLGQRLGEKQVMAACYMDLGMVYTYQGMLTTGLQNFLKALEMYRELRRPRGELTAYANISYVYASLGDNQKSMEYLYRALSLVHPDDKFRQAFIYNNLANAFIMQHDYDKALYYLEKSRKIEIETGNDAELDNYYIQIGMIYQARGSYQKAMESYRSCLKLAGASGRKSTVASAMYCLGDLALDNKEYVQAILWCRKGLALSSEIGMQDQVKENCNCLYKAYKGSGNSQLALYYFERVEKIDDSLKKQDAVKELQQMEFRFQMEKDSIKQSEARLKERLKTNEILSRQKTEKLIILFIGIIFLLAAFALWLRLSYIRRTKAVIEREKERSEELLLNILPYEVAEELKETGRAEAKYIENVSILFSDFKDFTQISEHLSAKELVAELNRCFREFDLIMQKYGIEKIKTIGDSYMAAGGLMTDGKDTVKNTVKAAIEMQEFLQSRDNGGVTGNVVFVAMRVGIHTGPVAAGIVGINKFQYDIWGDTVNTAQRMENSGAEGRVNISEATWSFMKDDPEFTFEYRGKINAKHKGEVSMYFVDRVKDH